MGRMSEKEKQELQLNEEEREILEAFEMGKLEPIEMSKEEIEDFKDAAKKVLTQRSRISISIPERDLKKIKYRAIESGIPYQTLIAAVLHQYAEGKISAAI